MQRVKEQLEQAQGLYFKNRELCSKRKDQLLETCDRIKNETFMWAGPKQLLEEIQKSCELQVIEEKEIVDLIKKNQQRIDVLHHYNKEYLSWFKQEEKE